jgi:undecaprenyl-diphosphatase
MFLPLWVIVILLGIVEGLTEFIPVSSTGHLILADAFLGFKSTLASQQKAALFEVVIQLGAILAIVTIYWRKLFQTARESCTLRGSGWRLWVCLLLSFVPAAAIGFAAHDFIEERLFSPFTVAIALVSGGVVILIIDRLPLKPTARSTEEMSFLQAFWVGIAQVASLFPGVSRSGATIMGGLCAGLDRPTATEFSFLLSLPIMLAASAYVLLKNYDLLDTGLLAVLSGGFVTAFVAAWVVVKWLIQYVQRHDFTLFALYRILFGMILLWFFWPKA